MAAAIAYGVTALFCFRAALVAHPRAPLRAGRWFWLGCALFLCCLAASRLAGLEDLVRNNARTILTHGGHYQNRWDLQVPLAAAAMFVVAAAAVPVVRWQIVDSRHPVLRHAAWARLGVLAMAGVIALRLISLHSIDALLYRPLHLNWVIDIGATLTLAMGAIRYRAKALTRPPAGSRTARPGRPDD